MTHDTQLRRQLHEDRTRRIQDRPRYGHHLLVALERLREHRPTPAPTAPSRVDRPVPATQ